MPPPSSPNPMVPPIRYRKGELIGCGAFGRVYMGMNLDSGELLAVKQVLVAANAASRERAQDHIREIEEEVKLLKNLSHPNIVRYLGTAQEEETLNILLEFVPGGSISSLLGKFGPFPEAVIRTYTKQLLLGLEFLHSNGIMHRDIKGANILVDNQGCIKLADFGASKQVVELATVSGAKSMKGTPYWMAPEVILQTGHSFSADIWSVGCTVIEMATGRPPWSQQYKEVAALFYIGSTKSHPEIPEHLSSDAKDFLLKCLDKDPDMRPSASDLVQHPFITGQHRISNPSTIDMEKSQDSFHPEMPDLSNFEFASVSGASDVCNLGSLSCSVNTKEVLETDDVWHANDSDDKMCLIDEDDFTTAVKKDDTIPPLCEFDQEQGQRLAEADNATQENDSPFSCGAEDDELLAESKIRGFIEEKALELEKLQTPLFEEFYNSINAASFCNSPCDGTPPDYLKEPPNSRSPSQPPFGTPSAVDEISRRSNSQGVSHIRNPTEQLQDKSFSQLNDREGLLVDSQSSSSTPSVNVSERQKKWKEELAEELKRQREMMLQAGIGSRTSSPKDRAINKPRERATFASPSK